MTFGISSPRPAGAVGNAGVRIVFECSEFLRLMDFEGDPRR